MEGTTKRRKPIKILGLEIKRYSTIKDLVYFYIIEISIFNKGRKLVFIDDFRPEEKND